MITPQFNDFLDQNQSHMEQALLELLAIESVECGPAPNAPFGTEVANALAKTAALATGLGLTAINKTYYTNVDIGEVKEPYTAVGILTHVDVVPVGEGWNFAPLGQMVDDKIYGRGTLDDKGPTIAILYALAAVKNSGLPLSKPVRLVVGGNEESGFQCVHKYVAEDIPLWGGFSPDGHFPVIFAEKGIAQFDNSVEFDTNYKPQDDAVVIKEITAGTVVNAVPGKAQAILNVKEHQERLNQIIGNHVKTKQIGLQRLPDGDILLTAIGKSAHGSTPDRGESAIKTLLEVVLALPLPQDSKTAWLQSVYKLFAANYYGEPAGVACTDQVSGKLTLNLGVLRLQGSQGSLEIDLRYPVTADFNTIQAKLQKTAETNGLSLTCSEHKQPLYVKQDSPLVQSLLHIYQTEADPNAQPLAIGGGTYCRAMENFVAFGPIGVDDEDTMHQADENIGRKHLLFLAKLYAEAIYQLAK